MIPSQSIIITRSNVAIFSIQTGITTTWIPPRAVRFNRTVVDRLIVIAIFRAELLTVVKTQAVTYQNIIIIEGIC